MGLEQISPDQVIYWQWGWLEFNATIAFTWLVGALIVFGSWWGTRKIESSLTISRWQHLLEIIVEATLAQIREVVPRNPERYLPFVGTLFIFIAVSNVLSIVPFFAPPMGSLSTTAGLALCVLIAVPVFGIWDQGLLGYLRLYIQPSPMMLPFNVIGELSRTLALAVRLFGNMMSGAKIAAILLLVAPLLFPVLTQLLGLLTGLIQAYIFAMLALVYIASATQAHESTVARSTVDMRHPSDDKGVSDHG